MAHARRLLGWHKSFLNDTIDILVMLIESSPFRGVDLTPLLTAAVAH